MSEQVHTIHIRKLSHEAYERLWNLRKHHGARSWAVLIDIITKEYVKQIEEFDWL